MDFQVWKGNEESFFRIVRECDDKLSVTSLLDDDGSRFECKVSSVMACQGDIIRSPDMIGCDWRVMGDLFRDELGRF